MTTTPAESRVPPLAGLVLAAGGGRRFGGPKALALLGGEPLVRRAARLLLPRCPAGVGVVTGAGGQRVAAAIGLPDVVAIHHPDWAEGLAGSLRRGVAALPARAGAVLVLPCDLPAITGAELDRLIGAWAAAPERPAASAHAGRPSSPAVLPRSLWPAVQDLTGDRGAGALLATLPCTLVDLPGATLDMDTPADLERLVRGPMLD